MQKGLFYKQVINKKENVGRTFILPTDKERMNACEKAFEIDDCVEDKNIIVVDDTIVRGNTFKALIAKLREKTENDTCSDCCAKKNNKSL